LFKHAAELSVIFRGEPLANSLDAIPTDVDEIFARIWSAGICRVAGATAVPGWSSLRLADPSAGVMGKQYFGAGSASRLRCWPLRVPKKSCNAMLQPAFKVITELRHVRFVMKAA